MERRMFIKKSAKDEIQLEFNEQIYPKEKIVEAVGDFRDVCRIALKNNVVTISAVNKKEDIEKIAREFSNYLLELVISGGIQCK